MYYLPNYDSLGNLDIDQLNKAIKLTSLQSVDGNMVDLIIEPSPYFFTNAKSIEIASNVNLVCRGVTFNVTIEEKEKIKDIILFNGKSNAKITGLNIVTFAKDKDIKDKWEEGQLFANKSIFAINNSNKITIDSCKVIRIFGCGVDVNNSYSCTISNSSFIDSWVKGCESGQQGYGISINGSFSVANKIINNDIKDTRHGIVLQYDCYNNVVEGNKVSGSKALKKVLWFTVLDSNWTYDITLHGNNAHHNIVKENVLQGNLYIDAVKDTPNGCCNELIGNTVKGRINVESFYPYTYNQGQLIKNNRYKSMSIKAKNCTVEGNSKL